MKTLMLSSALVAALSAATFQTAMAQVADPAATPDEVANPVLLKTDASIDATTAGDENENENETDGDSDGGDSDGGDSDGGDSDGGDGDGGDSDGGDGDD